MFLVSRIDDGKLYEEFTQQLYSHDHLVQAMEKALEHDLKRRSCCIVEEYIPGSKGRSIPLDYKLYTVGGEVMFMLQVDRNTSPATMAFFGRDLRPLELGTEVYVPQIEALFGEHEPPENWADMEAAAKRIAAHLKTPFISVDLYTTGDEVILGELTTIPGAPYYGGTMFRFMPSFDRQLGEAWAAANCALGIPIPRITSDPPCLLKEAALFSGGLEASLRKEIKMLRGELGVTRRKLASLQQIQGAS